MIKLDSLQGLRGIAASLVVAFHAVNSLKNAGWVPEYTSGFAIRGMAGVDIFFVISGFVMVLTTAHTIPLPELVPLAEIDKMPPGEPEPPVVALWANGVVLNRPPLNLY